jgi:PBP1b-binding outer membrane lipoprotein LpoB
MKKFNYIILISLFFYGCSGFSDAKKVLKNEKVKSTDEFLVKKKEPLVLPPDFDKLPLPDSDGNQNNLNEEKENFKKILNVDKDSINEKKTSSSIEESIIEKIR